jgi:hypothetical protein
VREAVGALDVAEIADLQRGLGTEGHIRQQIGQQLTVPYASAEGEGVPQQRHRRPSLLDR